MCPQSTANAGWEQWALMLPSGYMHGLENLGLGFETIEIVASLSGLLYVSSFRLSVTVTKLPYTGNNKEMIIARKSVLNCNGSSIFCKDPKTSQ